MEATGLPGAKSPGIRGQSGFPELLNALALHDDLMRIALLA